VRLDPITLIVIMNSLHTDRLLRSSEKTDKQNQFDSTILSLCTTEIPVTPDDHSEVVPPLPIPNRTVKRLSADDSAGSRVKVGHRQALIKSPHSNEWGL
jgi:hypothetical protein